MAASGRYSLLVYSSVAVIAGTLIMLGIVRASAPTGMSRDQSAQMRAPYSGLETQPIVERFAFVPYGALSRREVPLETAALRPEIAPEPTPGEESTLPWATEILSKEPEPEPSWQSTWVPALKLPWQSSPRRPARRMYTLKERLAEISTPATARLAVKFEAAKVPFPPAEIALIAIKDQKSLELHARGQDGGWKLVHRYRVLAASGGIGPKLQRGDKQVPEGLYAISFLNPNSAYHLSLRVNFPNAFDRQMAVKDARKDLGGDIMIHGKDLSAGCLAVGDEAVEEVFLLTARTGLSKVKLIIAPTDLREKPIPQVASGRPEWVPKLYTEIASAMSDFKQPPAPSLLSLFWK